MLQNVSGKKEEVKREKLACASALGQGVVLYNCPGRCYLLLAQGTFCVFSQEVCRYYYLILMFCQLSFQKVRSFSRREGNFGLWLSVSLQQNVTACALYLRPTKLNKNHCCPRRVLDLSVVTCCCQHCFYHYLMWESNHCFTTSVHVRFMLTTMYMGISPAWTSVPH